jgi:hypothetical protein
LILIIHLLMLLFSRSFLFIVRDLIRAQESSDDDSDDDNEPVRAHSLLPVITGLIVVGWLIIAIDACQQK